MSQLGAGGSLQGLRRYCNRDRHLAKGVHAGHDIASYEVICLCCGWSRLAASDTFRWAPPDNEFWIAHDGAVHANLASLNAALPPGHASIGDECVMRKDIKLRHDWCAKLATPQAVDARRTLCTKLLPGALRRRSVAVCLPCRDAL